MSISWSAMRKKLETEIICDSLKGRITYFATRYRKSHDEMGRVAVLLDGKEVLKSSWFEWAKKSHEIYEATRGPHIKGLTREEYWEKVDNETHNQCGFDQFCFYNAYYEYANQSINDSLNSADPIIRLFAILDRRVGKRTLEALTSTLDSLPDWLRYFYELRLESEGLKESPFSREGFQNEFDGI